MLHNRAHERIGIVTRRYERAHLRLILNPHLYDVAEQIGRRFDIANQDGSSEGLNFGIEVICAALANRVIRPAEIYLGNSVYNVSELTMSTLTLYAIKYASMHGIKM